MNYRVKKRLGVCLVIIFTFFAHGYWILYSTSVKTIIESVDEIETSENMTVIDRIEKRSSNKLFVFENNAKKSGIIKKISHIIDSLRKTDDVTLFEKRIEPLKAFLPQIGIIGYVSDTNDSLNLAYLQYSIIPLVIANDTRRDLVVGYIIDKSKTEDIVQREHLSIIKNFGNGLYLFNGRTSK